MPRKVHTPHKVSQTMGMQLVASLSLLTYLSIRWCQLSYTVWQELLCQQNLVARPLSRLVKASLRESRGNQTRPLTDPKNLSVHAQSIVTSPLEKRDQADTTETANHQKLELLSLVSSVW